MTFYVDEDALRRSEWYCIEDFNHQNIVITKIKNQLIFRKRF